MAEYRNPQSEPGMDKTDDQAVLLGDDQAVCLEVDRTERMGIQFVHAQRSHGRTLRRGLVPELDQARRIGIAERAESRHRS